ncbi:MAG: ABC transporter permease [Desulfobacteraceae bacterium]|jgi:ABC-2 type transport system permease protein
MRQFAATVRKELLLLRRDRSGLLVLFVMPAVLVLVITLVQDNAMKSMGESDTEILFIDQDRDVVGRHLESALSQAQGVHLIKTIRGQVPDKEYAVRAVAKGDFQLCLYVPPGITAVVKSQARKAAMAVLSTDTANDHHSFHTAEVEVYFDPAVMGGFRSAVNHLLQLMMMQIEADEKMHQLGELHLAKLKSALGESLGPTAADQIVDKLPPFKVPETPEPILKIRVATALGNAAVKRPNAVQQNIPAWSLFGIFFIVLPMAGSFIKERLSGVALRTLSLPVSYPTIVAGKMSAFMLVCLVQFTLILLIGKLLLPWLGTPPFELGASPGAAALVAFCATLAATGYGILLGTAVQTYEQASMFGPISIVIAAALGGIMVPVYAMPTFMQKISVISPLAWAQNAFLDLFARGGTLQSVLPDISLLLIFAMACIATAWLLFSRRVHNL